MSCDVGPFDVCGHFSGRAPRGVARAVNPHSFQPNRLLCSLLSQRAHECCMTLHAVGFAYAPTVTSRAVRSYRTFSPLPDLRFPLLVPEPSAVILCGTVPLLPVNLIPGGWALPTTVVLSCSDFPLCLGVCQGPAAAWPCRIRFSNSVRRCGRSARDTLAAECSGRLRGRCTGDGPFTPRVRAAIRS